MIPVTFQGGSLGQSGPITNNKFSILNSQSTFLRMAASLIMLTLMPKHPVSLRSMIITLTIAAALAPAAGRSDDADVRPFTFDNWLLAPVRVHLLSASNAPAIHTTLSETDVTRI